MSNPANFGDPILPARFWSKAVVSSTGCWLWTGGKTSHGYGNFRLDNKRRMVAHRVCYEAFNGLVPSGLEMDHLCRVRCCVNPKHLEAVTHAENVRRGRSPFILANQSGICVKGIHKLEANPCGGQICRECERARSLARYYRLSQGP